MSGSGAARLQRSALKIPVEILAWRIAFVWEPCRTRDDRNCKRATVESKNDFSGIGRCGQKRSL
jgi:hypothetical protein